MRNSLREERVYATCPFVRVVNGKSYPCKREDPDHVGPHEYEIPEEQ